MKNSLPQLRVKLILFLTFLLSIHFVQAQNWAQIIKSVASDREDKTTSGRSANDSFGYSVAISGSYAVVGAMNEDDDAAGANALENSGAAYLFYNNAGTWKKVKKLVASNRFTGSNFGSSVAIDGDYIVIGASNDSYGPSMRMGSAYIFKKDQGGADNWGEVKKITAPLRNENDFFGLSVSISSDHVIVGAYQEDQDSDESATLSNAGSAYLFKKDFGGLENWGFVQKITAPIRGEDDYFGRSVAISGDIAVVGAYQEDQDNNENNQLDDSGSAYIFKKDAGSEHWSLVKKITASIRSERDIFGFSVAIKGDNIIVGAPNVSLGAAYIFSKDAGGQNAWGEVKKLVAFDAAFYDNFGSSVSISDNFAIAGANRDSEDGIGQNTITGAGSAYIFRKDKNGSNQWGLSKKITSAVRNTGNAFGFSVAINGSYAVCSAPLEKLDGVGNKPLNGAGSAHIFYNPGSADQWDVIQQMATSTDAHGKRFANSISVDGQYAIVGATNDGEQNTGAAYMLKNVSGTWTQIKKLTADNKQDNAHFGQNVLLSGDYAVVGAFGTNGYKGLIHIFKKDLGGTDNWGLIREISPPEGVSYFGLAISLSKDNLLIGTSLEISNGNYGSAHVYNKNQGGADNWGYMQKIVPPLQHTGDQYGAAVCISGDTLVVGAASDGPGTAGGYSYSGAAYIFTKNASDQGNWTFVKKLVSSDRQESDAFGTSVSLNGQYVFVSSSSNRTDASFSGTNFQSAGAVYIFKNTTNTSNDWLQVQKITAPVRSSYAYFGNGISTNGMYAVIGSVGESSSPATTGFNQTGAAYIFKNTGGANPWSLLQRIQPTTLSAGDLFGVATAIYGKYVFVGAPNAQEDASEKNTVYQAGAAYIFADNTPLPVTLSSFEVKKSENRADLKWTTTSETNSDYFEIQKSQDGVSWQTIGSLAAAAESEKSESYSFTDAKPYAGENLYRLKMVDLDQTFAYSRIKSLSFDGMGILVFPNPASNKLFFTASEISKISVVNIINNQGKIVALHDKVTHEGIDITNLSEGIYLVQIKKTDGSVQVNKILAGH